MATPAVLDMPRLLTPVSEGEPAGPDLRSSPRKDDPEAFYAARDARKRAADAERRVGTFALLTEEERKAEPAAPEPPDWEAVRRLSIDALSRSKDMWITAWFIEGLTRLHGFAGLRDGVRLAHQLCEQFWEGLHPRAEAERFAQLAGLNGRDSEGTLIAAIMNVPVTPDTSIRSLTFADYKDAAELDRKDPGVRSRRVEQGAVTAEMFERAIAETPADYVQNTFDDLQQAADAYVSFNTFLSQKVSDKSVLPPSSRIRETLDECLRVCRTLTKDLVRNDGSASSGGQASGSADTTAAVASARPSLMPAAAAIETRQEALRTLTRVAEYFRQAEPHSPVSYVLEQVVRWARLPLPELLSELVTDKGAREEIFRLTGIAQPRKEE